MRRLPIFAAALIALASPAAAQNKLVVQNCGTLPASSATNTVGGRGEDVVDVNGNRCVSATQSTVTPLGYCQLSSLSSSTGLASCSGGIPSGSTTINLACETQAVRYRDDGVAPTASVGFPLTTGQVLNGYKPSDLTLLRIIEQTASAKCNILFYK